MLTLDGGAGPTRRLWVAEAAGNERDDESVVASAMVAAKVAMEVAWFYFESKYPRDVVGEELGRLSTRI